LVRPRNGWDSKGVAVRLAPSVNDHEGAFFRGTKEWDKKKKAEPRLPDAYLIKHDGWNAILTMPGVKSVSTGG
jgi:hypothetical protein